MNAQQLDEVLQYAIEIAKKAGAMIREGQAKRFADKNSSEKEKINSVDLVTEVDQAVEAFLIKAIQDKFPAHKFVGEETYTGQEVTADPTWICDPIDGTTNFVHGFPFVCTAIGFTLNKVPVVGVVYNPFLDQLYYAAKGSGAFLSAPSYGSSPIQLPLAHPKPLTSLSTALIAVEWGSYREPPIVTMKAEAYLKLAADGKKVDGGKMVHSMRSVGSSALNTCLVAAGSCDLYWEIGCWPWDVCAATVICAEAGGLCFGSKSGSFEGVPSGEILVGRKYMFVRGMIGQGDKSGKDLQLSLVKELFDTVGEYDP